MGREIKERKQPLRNGLLTRQMIKEYMKRKEFIEIFGELPEDMLGNDWENDIQELEVLKEITYSTSISEENGLEK